MTSDAPWSAQARVHTSRTVRFSSASRAKVSAVVPSATMPAAPWVRTSSASAASASRGDPAVDGERRDQGNEDACEAVFHWPSLWAAIMQVQFAFVRLYVSCADA
jgi:hypothetical protein